MSKADFDLLLEWLGHDGEPTTKYLEIQARLIQLFRFNGCDRPEDLADEVISRVATKIPRLENVAASHIAVFRGFARNVLHEYWNDLAVFDDRIQLGDEVTESAVPNMDTGTKELRAQCLDGCLSKLEAHDRRLLLEYHEYEQGGKIRHRKRMASLRAMTVNALRVRHCRLKADLMRCVVRCCRSADENRI